MVDISFNQKQDKMKREMKTFEKESLITDRRFENLTERDIVAHKKNVNTREQFNGFICFPYSPLSYISSLSLSL